MSNRIFFENLLGGYADEEYFVPVRFGLKHSKTGNATLYIVVDQNKIPLNSLDKTKKTEVLKVAGPNKTEQTTSRSVKYSISQIIPFVKSKDLLRYMPDDILSFCTKSHTPCCVYHSAEAARVAGFSCSFIRPVPSITQIFRLERLFDDRFFFGCVPARIAVWTVRAFRKRSPCSVVAFTPPFHAWQAYTVYSACITFSFPQRKFHYCLTLPGFLCYNIHGKFLSDTVMFVVVTTLYHIFEQLPILFGSYHFNTYIFEIFFLCKIMCLWCKKKHGFENVILYNSFSSFALTNGGMYGNIHLYAEKLCRKLQCRKRGLTLWRPYRFLRLRSWMFAWATFRAWSANGQTNGKTAIQRAGIRTCSPFPYAVISACTCRIAMSRSTMCLARPRFSLHAARRIFQNPPPI